jgi:hypothetical protein
LRRDFGEKMSEPMQVAILLSVCPEDIQSMVVKGAGPLDTYRPVRDRMRELVDNKLAHSSLSMDVAAIKADEAWWWTAEAEELLAAIGKGGYPSVQCHNCDGKGNFARDCLTPKGKGKGKHSGV